MSLVSKMYPRGIQLRNLIRVSRVAPTSDILWEFSCSHVGEVRGGGGGGDKDVLAGFHREESVMDNN